MKKMRLLFSGSIEHLNESWLKGFFPNCHCTIVVPKGTPLKVEDAQTVSVTGTPDQVFYKSLFDACDYDYIVYFSKGLNPGQSPVHEQEDLSAMMNAILSEMKTRILYLRPAKYLIASQEADTYQSAESVLQYTLPSSRYVTLGCPYLYHLQGSDPFFLPMYQALDRNSRDNLNFSADHPAAFLEFQELGKLLHQFCFDNFPANTNVVELPTVQELTMKDIADTITSFSKGWTVRLKAAAAPVRNPAMHDGDWLAKHYGWTPVRNIQKDLPVMFEHYRRTFQEKHSFIEEIIRGFRGKSKLLMQVLELALAALLMEVCLSLSADTVQFSIIDYRLLFVVIISSVFGLRLGIAAALIASIRLFQAYLAQGYDAMVLFYEPTNWMGFIAYFLCGIACGFSHWSSKERKKIMAQENDLLSEKYVFLKGLYDNSLTDRDTYKEQILNSRSSYSKVLHAAQMLSANTLSELGWQIVKALEYLLGNQTIGVYAAGKANSADLISRSVGSRVPQKIQLDVHSAMYKAVAAGDVYMNTDLQENCPACAIGICLNKKLKLLVTIQTMPFENMTLATHNLLKSMGEQIAVAVDRAADYEKLKQQVS